jgi:hypothetical protein
MSGVNLPDGYPLTRTTFRHTGSNYGYGYTSLFGVTGSIHIHARRTIIDSDSPLAIALFKSHTRSEIGALPSDEAGISQMFWLSVGCISAPGSKIYSLDDVESIDVEEEASKPTGLHRT